MEDASTTNPLFVALFFVLRCLVPLLVMLGITYLLKRLGFIAESPPPPPEENNDDNHNNSEGGFAHV
jgi:hypothetical protein